MSTNGANNKHGRDTSLLLLHQNLRKLLLPLLQIFRGAFFAKKNHNMSAVICFSDFCHIYKWSFAGYL
ncbi:hypothetical protein ACS0TY_026926 [Phlomoides rotata]